MCAKTIFLFPLITFYYPHPLFNFSFLHFFLLLFLLGPGANGGKEGFGIVKSFPPRLFILHGGEGEEERF